MTDGLSEDKAKWLTYLVYLLLTFQTAVMGWVVIDRMKMPQEFVRLERYKCDIERIEKLFERIDRRLGG